MESDKPEPYLLGFDNAQRQTSECSGCGATAVCVDPFHSLGSPYAGLCKACVKFKAAQSNAPKYLEHSVEVQSGRPVAPLSQAEMERYENNKPEPIRESAKIQPDLPIQGSVLPGVPASPCFRCGSVGRTDYCGTCGARRERLAFTRPKVAPQAHDSTAGAHLWAIASFDTGARLGNDPRPPEESGLWTWTCSACGFTKRSISSVDPPTHSPICVSRSARRGKLSERLRSLLGGREVPAEKKWRFENLLCWMDRYQEEDFPIPPHWVSEALEIMAEGQAK